MSSDNDIVIHQYSLPKSWSVLPTFDPESLKYQTYMRFCGIKYEVNNINDPTLSPNGELPYIVIDNTRVFCNHQIVDALKELGHDVDSLDQSNPKSRLSLIAFSHMVSFDLHNCQMYDWWVDVNNYESITHASYSSLLPFPRNWITPKQMKSRYQSYLFNLDYSNDTFVYSRAENIYKTLSEKLGDKPFFFGDQPTFFDAIAFSSLATQYYAPFNKSRLRYLISKFENLNDYITRILKVYYDIEAITMVIPRDDAWIPRKQFLKVKEKKPSQEQSGSGPFIALGLGILGLFVATQNKQTESFVQWFSQKPNEKENVFSTRRLSVYDEDDYIVEHIKKNDLFFDKENEPYVEDDGKAYDWNENYLEELHSGNIPEDDVDLDEGDDDDDDDDDDE